MKQHYARMLFFRARFYLGLSLQADLCDRSINLYRSTRGHSCKIRSGQFYVDIVHPDMLFASLLDKFLYVAVISEPAQFRLNGIAGLGKLNACKRLALDPGCFFQLFVNR